MSNKESIVIRNQPSKVKLIIFDFDGVLADSFNFFYPLIRDGMASIGLDLTANQYRDFFIGNVHQSFKDFINNEKKYLSFSEFRKNNYDKYYYDKKNGVRLFWGAQEFIKKLDKKYILAIVSSGHQKNIENLLKENGLTGLFNFVLANVSYAKEGMIEEVLDRSNTKAEETIMISDTVGDIMVAKKVGFKTIAVTWGFQSAGKLKKSNPDIIVKNFKDLLAKIDKLS